MHPTLYSKYMLACSKTKHQTLKECGRFDHLENCKFVCQPKHLAASLAAAVERLYQTSSKRQVRCNLVLFDKQFSHEWTIILC